MTESLEPIKPAADNFASLRALEAQVSSLQTLAVLTLMAGLLLSAGVNFFLFREVSIVRKDLDASQRIVDDYETTRKPLINAFVTRLQGYAQSHPDFQPMLQKYGIPLSPSPQSPQPAASTAPVK